MRVLALNPFHGGSHRAFLDGWMANSQHRFTLLTLPARHWKWRMRHAAVTFAETASQLRVDGECWDAVLTTDMLNLAEFRGLCPAEICRLPSVVYFHENQLTYPVVTAEERDLHFAFTNLTTSLAATRVWFNSAFHRDEYHAALDAWRRRLPGDLPTGIVEGLRRKSRVEPPAIERFQPRETRRGGPLRLVWAARWEHDKAPDTFFTALESLENRGCDFRVSVLGESFSAVPPCFSRARRHFADRIDHWGFLPDHRTYRSVLQDADVVVSTAHHEFFGLAVVEAVAAGCFPMVPNRLAYPEVLGREPVFFHDGTARDLAHQLERLADRVRDGVIWEGVSRPCERLNERYGWKQRAPAMDDAIESL